METAYSNWPKTHSTFMRGDPVRKRSGSHWHGTVVGWYSTELIPEGYAVESFTEPGSVQIYSAHALVGVPNEKNKPLKIDVAAALKKLSLMDSGVWTRGIYTHEQLIDAIVEAALL